MTNAIIQDYRFNMNTKLLKKVRKRYKITKITKIDNPRHWLYGETKFPVWTVCDTTSTWRYFAYGTYDEAYAKLTKMIHRDYYHYVAKKRRHRGREEKLWYV